MENGRYRKSCWSKKNGPKISETMESSNRTYPTSMVVRDDVKNVSSVIVPHIYQPIAYQMHEWDPNWPTNGIYSNTPRVERVMKSAENGDELQGQKNQRSSRNSSSSQLLPSWALDSNGEIKKTLSIRTILDTGELLKFALDKAGCQYLQNYISAGISDDLKDMLFEQVFRYDIFLKLSNNMFGNFFVQQVLEMSVNTKDEKREYRQKIIAELIGCSMYELCLNKSACRVVQSALVILESRIAIFLVQCLPRDDRLINICLDQNSNHVIQKITHVFSLRHWKYIVEFVANPYNLRKMCRDKYGCRVVQTIIERLNTSDGEKILNKEKRMRQNSLQTLMHSIIDICSDLVLNEYANYILQHILSRDDMAIYRESIISKCLMRNILSLSQEKFASHVVEKAFWHAPLRLLAEMMDEVFNGYVPHPETGKDALDIMLFHQFGNYVVQCMLTICCDSCAGLRETYEGGYNHKKSFEVWLKKLRTRILKERHRLSRFSSGKKMIETLDHVTSGVKSLETIDDSDTTSYQEFGSGSEMDSQEYNESAAYVETD